jgi:hypothetical protein
LPTGVVSWLLGPYAQVARRASRTDGLRATICGSRKIGDSQVAGRTITLRTLMEFGVIEEIDTDGEAIG